MSYEKIEFHDKDGFNVFQYEIEFTRECPLCGEISKPDLVWKSHYNDYQNLVILFECQCCYSFYVNEYSKGNYPTHFDTPGPTTLIKYPRNVPVYFDLPSSFEKISPNFKGIYQQAQSAEVMGLDEIAGMGYRKSAEFLIKDYLIVIKGRSEDEISDKSLGACINLMDNDEIKSLARATSWLGNDETHYVRKHVDRDIKDLKKFLSAIASFINYRSTIDDAIKFTSKD